MKKYFLIFSIIFFLFSCFSSGTNNGLTLFENDDFQINIPETWEIIKDTNKVLPKPKVWEINLVVKSKKEINWFANNLVILSENLSQTTNSTNYSISSQINSSKNFETHKKLKEEEEITFLDETKSKLYFFEARYNSNVQTLNFIQTAKVCDKKWYLITIALSKNIKKIQKYKNILSSFECN